MKSQLTELSALAPDVKDYLPQAARLLADIDPRAFESRDYLLALLNRLIAEIDYDVSRQLEKILADTRFVSLKTNWLGVESLVELPVSQRRTRVRILDVSAQELAGDLDVFEDISRTALYNLVANREFNTAGGQPFGLLLSSFFLAIDTDNGSAQLGLETASRLGQLGQACLCPVIFAPAPTFFGETDAGWFADTARMHKLLSGPYFSAWREFRQRPSAKYVAVVMPSFRLHGRYRDYQAGVLFDQNPSHSTDLWCNPVFVFAAVVMREFSRTSWFGFLRSVLPGRYQGSMINLAPQSHAPQFLVEPVAKYSFSKTLAEFYGRWGFITATRNRITGKYLFLDNPSVSDAAKLPQHRIDSRIETTLAICRVAHYVKKRIRHLLGRLLTPAECESELRAWLSRYTTELDSGDESLLCRYPLRAFSLSLDEVEDARVLHCVLRVVPQWQLDDIGGEITVAIEREQ